MKNICVVSGYYPLATHAGRRDYVSLGEELGAALGDYPRQIFTSDPASRFWYRNVAKALAPVRVPPDDDAAKNTLDYLAVQHQKTQWLVEAARVEKKSNVFVWIDYGVLALPGITAAVIHDFLGRTGAETEVAIPGCWPLRATVDDTRPCWRFCGGVVVVHRKWAEPFDRLVKRTAVRRMARDLAVTWEVNTWAHAELESYLDEKHAVPIRWYAADHNASLFTNYQPPSP